MENRARAMEIEVFDRLAGTEAHSGLRMEMDGHECDDEIPWMRDMQDVVWLMDFSVERKLRGNGRRALAELCVVADRMGVTLAANPWACGNGGLRQDQLERFYQSMGFGWRRDHVMLRDPMAPTAFSIDRDIAYQPKPNRSEYILDGTAPRSDLTSTAFVYPVLPDGRILMANNRRRGIEVPGGHIEPGETQHQAGMREIFEETGAIVTKLIPIGHQRMVSDGPAPEGWRYPLPLAYQSFFAARVEEVTTYVENDECLTPVATSWDSMTSRHLRIYAERAHLVVLGQSEASK